MPNLPVFIDEEPLILLWGFAMGRTYPSAPVCAVGGIIFKGDQVLLVKRSKAPAEGKWSIPGGVVHLGETLEEAVKRELFEEVQLVVHPIRIGKVLERIFRDAEGKVFFHYIIIDYVCEILSGVANPGSDAAAAGYYDIELLESLDMTEGTADIIREIYCRV
jgi:ADP-ribose pyrophosphatase YjhB (NUDIX family)